MRCASSPECALRVLLLDQKSSTSLPLLSIFLLVHCVPTCGIDDYSAGGNLEGQQSSPVGETGRVGFCFVRAYTSLGSALSSDRWVA
jgi:hypothetical protein